GLEAEHEIGMLELLGIPYPWAHEWRQTGDGQREKYFPGGPPDAALIPVYDFTLHSCNYYFRDLAQEKQERDYPGRPYTKLPLEYLTNVMDLSQQEWRMINRYLDRQLTGDGDAADPPPPPLLTPEELANIDELPPAELES